MLFSQRILCWLDFEEFEKDFEIAKIFVLMLKHLGI